MVNTKAIYLSVLEAGLSLIAVNLPSLWFLFSKVTPESVLRSVRSMISLGSERSASSVDKKGSHAYSSPPGKNRSLSSSSHSHFVHPEAQSIETCAMHDIEDVGYKPPLPLGKIHVTDRISQSTTDVEREGGSEV